jgi:glyoxylase-like metal-dependent hydrolase (beta-lactamase superfamily II)
MPANDSITSHLDRRSFLGISGGCAAHLMLMASVNPRLARLGFAPPPRADTMAAEPWGRLERLADGAWSMVSTPLDGDRTTLCNGGIIAGSNGVMVIESFASEQGAAWMAAQARQLTGRPPTHVVLTHFHGDHTGGLAAYVEHDNAPEFFATETTRDLVRQTDEGRAGGPSPERAAVLANLTLLPTDREHDIDLGDRRVRVIPRIGHTPSDVTVELEDPSIVWCGDLVWNAMFPNYRDAIPSRLAESVRALRRERTTVYVAGHGNNATVLDLTRYQEVLDHVGHAARTAFENGVPAETAAGQYHLPVELGTWVMFSPRYYSVAFQAWERELRANQ